jgi:type IV pilus assembly protein PilQ
MGSAVAAISVTTVSAATQTTAHSKQNLGKNLIAQTRPPANQQPLVPNPKITIDGIAPTPGVGLATPTMPRAVAPPVGDISVSNLNGAIFSAVDLGADKNIPNMVMRDTPVHEVLEVLIQSAGLNMSYVAANPDDKNNQTTAAAKEPKITINLRNESLQSAFNYVLKMSGYEAVRAGRTIFVGPKLPDSIQENVVRTLRVNQISAPAAAAFLAAQGAEARTPQETTVTETLTVGKVDQITTKKSIQVGLTSITTANAPTLLRGLAVNVDERLNSITLVGTARKVEIASAMITRLDARRRQVAINVKIVDVNLSNIKSMSNSLSFKAGDGFFSSDNGAAVYNYGGYNPATSSQVLSSPTTPPIIPLNIPGGGQTFLDYSPTANLNGQTGGGNLIDPISGFPVTTNIGNIPRLGLGSEANPYQPGVTSITPATTGYVISPTSGLAVAPGGLITPAEITTPAVAAQPAQPATFNAAGMQLTPFQAATPAVAAVIKPAVFNTAVATAAKYTYATPTSLQLPSKFLSTLQAQIISGNGKILTDPTLVVQEGQKSSVNLTQEVFGGFETNSTAGTGATITNRKPIIKNAGLKLDLLVSRIDDNGYVSVGVSPTVSSIGGSVASQDGEITLLQERTMNSGDIRLRDGQTLILSGIIQESDRSTVSKVPILGDIPILGALFRSTNKTNQRQEVVILLTPQILNDNKTEVNYTPGSDARIMMKK